MLSLIVVSSPHDFVMSYTYLNNSSIVASAWFYIDGEHQLALLPILVQFKRNSINLPGNVYTYVCTYIN